MAIKAGKVTVNVIAKEVSDVTAMIEAEDFSEQKAHLDAAKKKVNKWVS